MKKLSLIMAMVLIATIGGVYAAWQYAEGAPTSAHRDITITLEDPQLTTAKGTLTYVEDNLLMRIDQESSVSWNAVLKITGSVTFKYTKATGVGASDDTVDLQMKLTLIDANGTYLGEKILTLKDGSTDVTEVDGIAVGTTDAGTGLLTIQGSKIAEYLKLGATFNLPTYADYQAFNTALGAPVLKIQVSEVPAGTP